MIKLLLFLFSKKDEITKLNISCETKQTFYSTIYFIKQGEPGKKKLQLSNSAQTHTCTGPSPVPTAGLARQGTGRSGTTLHATRFAHLGRTSRWHRWRNASLHDGGFLLERWHRRRHGGTAHLHGRFGGRSWDAAAAATTGRAGGRWCSVHTGCRFCVHCCVCAWVRTRARGRWWWLVLLFFFLWVWNVSRQRWQRRHSTNPESMEI